PIPMLSPLDASTLCPALKPSQLQACEGCDCLRERAGRGGKANEIAMASSATVQEPIWSQRQSLKLSQIQPPATGPKAMPMREAMVAAPEWASPAGLAVQPRRLMSGAGHIFRIAATILMDALGRQLQHAVGERGEEAAIMRDEQHRALELGERLDQHLL